MDLFKIAIVAPLQLVLTTITSLWTGTLMVLFILIMFYGGGAIWLIAGVTRALQKGPEYMAELSGIELPGFVAFLHDTTEGFMEVFPE